MAIQKRLDCEDKLAALREAEPDRPWTSLDDRRCCILCEKTFSGRQVFFVTSRSGRIEPRCPTDKCVGAPAEWVHAGNPLISGEARIDGSRLIETLGGRAKTIRRRSVRLHAEAAQ